MKQTQAPTVTDPRIDQAWRQVIAYFGDEAKHLSGKLMIHENRVLASDLWFSTSKGRFQVVFVQDMMTVLNEKGERIGYDYSILPHREVSERTLELYENRRRWKLYKSDSAWVPIAIVLCFTVAGLLGIWIGGSLWAITGSHWVGTPVGILVTASTVIGSYKLYARFVNAHANEFAASVCSDLRRLGFEPVGRVSLDFGFGQTEDFPEAVVQVIHPQFAKSRTVHLSKSGKANVLRFTIDA